MQQIKNLFGDRAAVRTANAGRRSERGDLLTFFHQKLNMARAGTKYPQLSIRRIAVELSHLSTADLYFLKSSCLQAEQRNIPFGAAFWSSIKAKPQGSGLGER